MRKLIIEARVYEYMMRDTNPLVPWTAGELARDAAAVEAAGARVLHFHARQADSAPAQDCETYRDASPNSRRREVAMPAEARDMLGVINTGSHR